MLSAYKYKGVCGDVEQILEWCTSIFRRHCRAHVHVHAMRKSAICRWVEERSSQQQHVEWLFVDTVDTRSCIFPIGIGGGAPWADSRASFIAAFEATDVDGWKQTEGLTFLWKVRGTFFWNLHLNVRLCSLFKTPVEKDLIWMQNTSKPRFDFKQIRIWVWTLLVVCPARRHSLMLHFLLVLAAGVPQVLLRMEYRLWMPADAKAANVKPQHIWSLL